MKTCYLDANLLIYFNKPDSPFYLQADSILSKLINEGWKLYLSPLILDEYFHNNLRFTKLTRPQAMKLLKKSFSKIIMFPNIQLVNPTPSLKLQSKVLDLMDKYSLRARDAYHLFIMKENKIGYIATFDNDFEEVFRKSPIKKFQAA